MGAWLSEGISGMLVFRYYFKNVNVITRQLPVASWYDVIGEETIADAILERLVHSSFRVELKV